MDFQGKPFGPIPQILATAEYVTKVHAICMRCGKLAHISHRTVHNDKLVMLGETESYEPLCRTCYQKAHKKN
jgi:thymidine kinase